jgi:ABC-type multidrug transport system fused ATPase/permease subunit
MDEATVAVSDETDSAIQKVMRTEFADVHYGRPQAEYYHG